MMIIRWWDSRRIGWLLLLLFCTSAAGSDVRLRVADREGLVFDSVAAAGGGATAMVALSGLAAKAGWGVTLTNHRAAITHAGGTVYVRDGNPFAERPDGFVQLRTTPAERELDLLVAAADLDRLFPDEASYDPATRTIRLLKKRAGREPQASEWRLQTIIVDPGHGGKDPGALGAGGVQEKTVVLDIAKRLAALLRERGLTVELTRESDRFVSLRDRTRFANARGGDLFISIHCNSHRDHAIHGVEAYFLSPARTEQAVQAALKENAVVGLEEDTVAYAALEDAGYILVSMAASQNLRDSEVWAGLVAEAAAERTGLSPRGVDQAGFYVLMGAAMPAVLVECGYLSHSGDARYLTSDEGRQRLADALAASVFDLQMKLESPVPR